QFESHQQVRDEDFTKDPKRLYYVYPGKPSDTPVAIFTRDTASGHQVWSGHMGYPGDPYYSEFHKKRFPGGLRYWRVTDANADLGDKHEYEPERVDERIRENADHFCGLVRGILFEHYEATGTPGVVCAPYDAELFGHWWFEGVRWLKEALLRLSDDPDVAVTTCHEALEAYPPTHAVKLPEGSWGEGGYHYIWLNENTEWVWKLVYEAETRMQKLLRRHRPDETFVRILLQTGRELLLLESSDWPFVISTAHARDYAHVRINHHYDAFSRLAGMAESYDPAQPLDDGDAAFLSDCETRDGLFPYLDLSWFAIEESLG
ncbi:MAG: DUF1957 domain-containing protein, partial [candidate division Zixibacteria bacterium]|nr:DUF1957 domain-containing protein [candidate division Zixibacteria bacterium]